MAERNLHPKEGENAFPPCPPLFPQALLAQRVPWIPQAKNAPLNPLPQSLIKMAASPLPFLRLGYALFYLSKEDGEKLLSLALVAARHVLVADFKPAERNLEVPAMLTAKAVTGLAGLVKGGKQYQSGRSFWHDGGLEGLVFRSGAEILDRRSLLGGAAVLVHLRRGCSQRMP